MKKILALAAGLVATLFAVSTAGYSWNCATHAYIAGRIAKLMPHLKSNVMYGIMAPDIFNLDFSTWDNVMLRGYTHGIPREDPAGINQDFMAVWANAAGPFERALALGYVAHNDAWGADYIAHWRGIPPPPAFDEPYENEHPGYIIALAVQLDQLLAPYWAEFEASQPRGQRHGPLCIAAAPAPSCFLLLVLVKLRVSGLPRGFVKTGES